MIPRLFVSSDLHQAAMCELETPQRHYLLQVLRLTDGSEVVLFNGRDGEWRGRIRAGGRRDCSVEVFELRRTQQREPDLWLCFAPLKRARIDYLVEKATELGAGRLRPVFTERTVVERINRQRLQAHAIEAAEQCERLCVPEVDMPIELMQLIESWPSGRRLILCDESGGGRPIAAALTGSGAEPAEQPLAILVGPEGGFSRRELDRLTALADIVPVGLGPRILRADTAALAALAICQALRGDWRLPAKRRWPDYASQP